MSWYVMRDLKRPNALEPAWKALPTHGVQVYTPMREDVVSKGGKRVRQMRPVLADLLFVKADKPMLDRIVAKIPTLQYRYVRGQGAGVPMTVSDEEMDVFMRATEGYKDSVHYYTAGEITPGMLGRRVRIIGGPLDGACGRLLSKRGVRKNRLVLELQGLLTATVVVEPELIEMCE